MGKSMVDAFADAALNYAKNNGVLMTVCNAEPTNYTEASATYKLADVVIDSADFTGPADDAVSPYGRKITTTQQNDVPVDTTGAATHVAICAAAALILVTTCTSQSLTSGNTVTIPAFKDQIGDPT
jgi:rhamnogalacturonyl hydrolase YesR